MTGLDRVDRSVGRLLGLIDEESCLMYPLHGPLHGSILAPQMAGHNWYDWGQLSIIDISTGKRIEYCCRLHSGFAKTRDKLLGSNSFHLQSDLELG